MMEFVTSRREGFSDSADEIRDDISYHPWSTRQWPFREIVDGDTVYLYDSGIQRIVWKCRTRNVVRSRYSTKEEAKAILTASLRSPDEGHPYWKAAPDRGYLLAYRLDPIARLSLPKPQDLRFPGNGWLRVNEKVARTWLGEESVEEGVILDDLTPEGTILSKLRCLNTKLAGVEPKRVESIISHTVRQDTRLVKALKELHDFRCQFPGCGVRIRKRDGGFYVEVAHIQPVREGGRSVIGNLLVLCPNHHREFDYGELRIDEQNAECVSGILNGTSFTIATAGERSAG